MMKQEWQEKTVVERAQNAQTVEVLMAAGATMRHGLFDYAREGCLGGVLMALQAGEDVNVGGEKRTPLHEAAMHNRLEVAKVLLAHGAGVNRGDCNGDTPLAYAGSPEMEALLRQHGGYTYAGIGMGSADIGGIANEWSKQKESNSLTIKGNLAGSLALQGKHAEAEKMQREVLTEMKRLLGEEHPNTLTTAGNLADSLVRQGKYDEAEKMQREVLAVTTRVLGAEHPNTLTRAGNLAAYLSDQGKYDEAVAMEREVLAVKQRVLGAEHPNTLTTAVNLADSLRRQGNCYESEKMERDGAAGAL
jgi:tetratricopeptide (TPR) repeat protein